MQEGTLLYARVGSLKQSRKFQKFQLLEKGRRLSILLVCTIIFDNYTTNMAEFPMRGPLGLN